MSRFQSSCQYNGPSDLDTLYSLMWTQIIAAFTSTIIYGINVLLAATCTYILWKTRYAVTSTSVKKVNPGTLALIFYVFTMFCLSTVIMGTVAIHIMQRLKQILFLSDHLTGEQIFNLFTGNEKTGEVIYLLSSWGADLLLVSVVDPSRFGAKVDMKKDLALLGRL
ncbi:hypothetical protein BDQ17DRAFT_254675 [Cyathus striatus]|nr:hypothetical protein BDQ17DRAFT_254675 [Cyathus striatus]